MKQKLKQRNTCTPRNTSLVPVLCDSTLNNDEGSHSVLNLKTCFNNPEVNLLPGVQGGQDLRVPVVYVLNQRGKPLMPTTPRKARVLLRKGEAHVVKRTPFTIKLNKSTGESKQSLVLGVDPGYKNIGLSVISNKKEVYSSTVNLRTDTVKLNSERKMYRRIKRNRLWYRKPRFLNRKKDKGWLSPSIRHRLNSHIRIINNIVKIIPISQVNVEVNNFDIQKINNPNISGKEYQEGNQLSFYNVREYVLCRDNYRCQNCNKTNIKLNAHHIISRQNGGDRPNNLITLCKVCHIKYHLGKIKLKIKNKRGFRAETFMSTIKNKLIEEIKKTGCIIHISYGYITKYDRKQIGLLKSHINDAFVIAGGYNRARCLSYNIKQRRRNNRCLQLNRKGFKPSIRRQRYNLQPMSLVKYKKRILSVIGVQSNGKQLN